MTDNLVGTVAAGQRQWALAGGLGVTDGGHLTDVDLNVLGCLSPAVREAFENADGSELKSRNGSSSKMCSLISSSALAVNVFQHWYRHDAAPLARALTLGAPISTVTFEKRMPTGAGGTPPNLDVVLTTLDGRIAGIESKFTEWMTPKRSRVKQMAPYFRKSPSLWDAAKLHRCAALASDIYQNTNPYQYLDAPQLLKHALGLNRNSAGGWSLYYIWFDDSGESGARHRDEIARFAERVRDDIQFVPLSYQSLVARLASDAAVDVEYLTYLRRRYRFGESSPV